MAGKTIAITGATRGLGAALVQEFLAAGHTVIGCGRTATLPLAAVDVRDAAAVKAWANAAIDSHGPPDILICNAAVMNTPAPLWTVPQAEFDDVIDVNVKGVANTIRAFVPAMVKRKVGVIVNLSSGWGRSVSPDVAPYCATKYAIEGLTLALAQELPRGMAAVPLNPGVIDTDMLRMAWAEGASAYPKAGEWAKRAAPFILALGEKDNGRSLSVK